VSEHDNIPVLGRVEITPKKGFKLSIIDVKDVKKKDHVVIVKKEQDGLQAIEGSYEVKEIMQDKIILVPTTDLGDPKIRKALAKAIVRMNKEAIMEQSVFVAEEALARKPIPQLKNFFKEKLKGHKLKLRTQTGCILLSIGDEETVL